MPDLDDKSISDLTTVSDSLLGEDTLVEISAENAGTPSSFKATLGAIFDKILRSVSFTQRLNTTDKTVFGAINELQAGGGGGSSNVPNPTAANKTIKSQSDGEGGYEWTETDYYPYNGWTALRFIDGQEVNIGFTNLYALSTNASNPVWGVVLLSNDNYQTVSDAIPVVLTGSFNTTYRGYTDHTVYFVGAKDGKLYTVYLTDSTSHPNLKCDVEVEITDIGGGTSDYSNLTNKPSINSVTLSGNKTSADLGIPNTVELTKAEYDNLSEAEKLNGTLYFITDGQSGGGGGASEAEYSTVEHEVGTWIDGSTLYERTFVCRANNTDLITFTGTIREGGTYDLGLTNVANVQLFGMNTTRADSGQTQYTDIAPLSTEVFVSFRNTDGALYFKAVHGAVDLTVTLRYTKTSS